MRWRDYAEDHPTNTVVGTLKQLKGVWSPQLRNKRDLLVALPPGYGESTDRYPVLYMHDGQNLFDDYASYAGEWRVDETLELLANEGLPLIIVGVPNAGRDRIREYSPFADPRFGGGKGDQYLSFLVNTVKPLIDRDWRTRSGQEYTGLMGSSMGGLISLYGFFRHPEVFGIAGVMSPSLWFAKRAIFPYVTAAVMNPGRLYLDMGGREDGGISGGTPAGDVSRSLTLARQMARLLRSKGYQLGDSLLFREDPEGLHNEATWASRLPNALRFMFGPSVREK